MAMKFWHYASSNENATAQNFKVFVPLEMQDELIAWYHETLFHPGRDRMFETIARHFAWPKYFTMISKFVQDCPICQQNKIRAVRNYGQVSLDNRQRNQPFEAVHLDLIGPWKIDLHDEERGTSTVQEISALTCIDRATSYPEFHVIRDKTSRRVATTFDNEWLCRYPRPKVAHYDTGGEFTGDEFQELLASYDIQAMPTTVKNPRANAIIEQIHLTMGDMLRTKRDS